MAYATGAVLIAALAAGCSGDTGTGDSADDSKPGAVASSTAPPGKYSSLPEACTAIPPATLKDLLPGTAELPEAQQEKIYEGSATVTYDTDRRVGCRWKSDAPEGVRSVHIDFERVVSYDTSVSDDDRAREVYAKKEEAADLPPATGASDTAGGETPASPSATGGPAKGEKQDGGTDPSADPSENTDSPDGSDGSPAENLQPRVLDGLGDSAFLDDALPRAGSTAQHHTVSVVFRTSNVIVTIEYTAQPALATADPDSRELQEKAQALGRKLVESIRG
ncbi:DUF3558 domain-containing protein [Streptomyces sp. ITFR-16]|uniref:DUF3558 domain-containing protein n=1 Tax=Streptomyces sp. ITFR-16 TaxID=3075198 RepID=UPI00288A8F82|nr:DUF3558 domain-containing protein [Streptomyces sp. ITFR-16]WNI24179.1 DUF3558 domain-containing protein [Streptomyces sp. ITFR-16]